MLFNTTYQVDLEEARNFVIWLHECYIPQVKSKDLFRILVLQESYHTENRTLNVLLWNLKLKIQQPCTIGIISMVWILKKKSERCLAKKLSGSLPC